MRVIESPESVAPTNPAADAEREEVEWLLTSGVLGRSGNLARVLRYICETRFAGRAHKIKEYTIATEALGRRTDFDPHTDTIVRVTVHSLRKRLQEVYQHEGADRPFRLVIPPGRYDPSFVPMSRPHLPPAPEAFEPPKGKIEAASPPKQVAPPARLHARLWTAVALKMILLIAGGLWASRHWLGWADGTSSASSLNTPKSLPAPQATIHALMGSGRKTYVDHSGQAWTSGNFCQGGSDVSVPAQKIEGTEDAPVYLAGVHGMAHCLFPVTQKLYELHFYFAETSDLPPATRVAFLSINAGPSIRVDVVDEAGGHGIATAVVAAGVVPENDGSIHVDFTSEISLLDAVDVVPAPSPRLLPVRIVAGSRPFTDGEGQFWASDRYFSGGRRGQTETVRREDLGLYQSDRIGRFRYSIPAVPDARYRVRLFFREPWFGKDNGGSGGPGSRVFDVSCNGELLLKNFDILGSGGSPLQMKTFEHIQASRSGRIELSFIPVVNYPVVNAIEVVPED